MVAPLHIEPPTLADHGTEKVVRDLWLHGIADADAIHVQTQQGNAPGTGKKWYATYENLAFANIRFGTCWRTPAGADRGLHVDRFQALGVPADAPDRANHVTSFAFLGCRWDNSGDPMPADGSKNADACLLQEGQFPTILWERCVFEAGQSPAKITLRKDWCYAKRIIIRGTPNFRLYIDALRLDQVGEIIVENSPGFVLSDAKNLGFKGKIVIVGSFVPPDPTAELRQRITVLESKNSTIEAESNRLKLDNDELRRNVSIKAAMMTKASETVADQAELLKKTAEWLKGQG